MSQHSSSGRQARQNWTRRGLLAAGALGASAAALAPALQRSRPQSVFIARNQTYTSDLQRVIEDGFRAVELPLEHYRGKRVLLKPNMVEPTRKAPHMTTHPAIIVATAAVFLRHGAIVSVGEAPGHVRDTTMALEESGIREALDSEQIPFADLNYEDVTWRASRLRFSGLGGLYMPQSVAAADLIVSLPKMKTHHWMGVTAAMKNLYGVAPGSVYGWPKNVLHHNGIAETICDINSCLPRLATVVDAIQCMEGDGPILGTPKQMGLVLVGENLAAVDATVCRLMRLNPARIPYLSKADGVLGPIAESRIHQRGEIWEESAKPFQILDEPHLNSMREGVLIS
ncbi:MAG: DUF362 domain-containing protein [Planctomycetales bacterium]|nr:DUF362 domain-containing protein [Planctomycetales bacterium]